MKKIFMVMLAVFAVSTALFADDGDSSAKKSNPPTTLFGSSGLSLSGFGALDCSGTRIGEKYAVLTGLRGGLIVDDNLVFGLRFMGLGYPTKRDKLSGDDYSGTEPYTMLGYGGFLFEYHFAPKNLFHFAVGTTIGGGGLGFGDRRNRDGDNDANVKKFFVIEPEVTGYVNVTRFCRLGVGVSYRFTNGANAQEFSDKDFRGFNVNFIAAFGWF
jgi:hypothetical protein